MPIQVKPNLAHVLSVVAFATVLAVTLVRLSELPPAVASQTRVEDTLSQVDNPPGTSADKDNVSEQFRSELAGLKEQLARTPDDLTVLGRLGIMHQSAHQPAQAAEYFERYLALEPNNRQMRLDLAQCYASMQRWDEALRVSLSLLEIDPEDPVAMYNVGAIHANRGELSEARKWWEKVRLQQVDEQLAAKAGESLASISSPNQ